MKEMFSERPFGADVHERIFANVCVVGITAAIITAIFTLNIMYCILAFGGVGSVAGLLSMAYYDYKLKKKVRK